MRATRRSRDREKRREAAGGSCMRSSYKGGWCFGERRIIRLDATRAVLGPYAAGPPRAPLRAGPALFRGARTRGDGLRRRRDAPATATATSPTRANLYGTPGFPEASFRARARAEGREQGADDARRWAPSPTNRRPKASSPKFSNAVETRRTTYDLAFVRVRSRSFAFAFVRVSSAHRVAGVAVARHLRVGRRRRSLTFFRRWRRGSRSARGRATRASSPHHACFSLFL